MRDSAMSDRRFDAICITVRRDAGAVEPGAIGVAKKVIAGFGRKISAGKIKPPRSVVTGSEDLEYLLRARRAYASNRQRRRQAV